jgi:ribose-phosphate pyrophosphokinase
MDRPMHIFSGNANRPLAQEIAQHLNVPLGEAFVGQWKDGESRVRIEENVRGTDVFVVQPTCPPVNHHLMELLIVIDALRRASANRITAVMPYFGYAKQEKKTAGREPITARLVANLITTAGASRILTMDLHAAAIEGFFDIPVDHLRAVTILADYFQTLNLGDEAPSRLTPRPGSPRGLAERPNGGRDGASEVVVVSPDVGGVGRANEFRRRLGAATLAIVAKHRPQQDVAEFLEMVGEVQGKTAIIVDDLIQSGGTLIEATDELLHRGARAVYACATHPVFAGQARQKLTQSALTQVVVTNTIPVALEPQSDKIRVLSVAPLLAEAISRIHQDVSLSSLFL